MGFDRFIEDILDQINGMMRRLEKDIEEMVKGLQEKSEKMRERPMVFGFTFGLRDRKPEFRTFGDMAVKGAYRIPVYEQIVDESKRELRVIIELPGIEKEDIKLDVSAEYLRLEAVTGERKYRAEFRLKRLVDPNTASGKFSNGVVEVFLRLKGEGVGEFTPVRVE